jgi:uncharacterized membrane protein YphA (DoxX/SURF4 family)
MNRTWTEWAPLPLRLMLGFGFMYHGARRGRTVEPARPAVERPEPVVR